MSQLIKVEGTHISGSSSESSIACHSAKRSCDQMVLGLMIKWAHGWPRARRGGSHTGGTADRGWKLDRPITTEANPCRCLQQTRHDVQPFTCHLAWFLHQSFVLHNILWHGQVNATIPIWQTRKLWLRHDHSLPSVPRNSNPMPLLTFLNLVPPRVRNSSSNT